MTEKQIKAISYNILQVGKNIKSSKIRHVWVFSINDKQCIVFINISMITSKISLGCNGRIVILSQDRNFDSRFQHSFVQDDCNLIVMQQGTNFELRINNKSFSHLLTQQKTKQHFTHQQKLDDFVLDSKCTKKQKIKLNFGSVDNNEHNPMKKKKNVVQSGNWNQFDEQENFPSYFQVHSQSYQPTYGSNQKIQAKQSCVIIGSQEDLERQPAKEEVQNNLQSINKVIQTVNQNLIDNTQNFNTMQNMFATNIPSYSNQAINKRQNQECKINISNPNDLLNISNLPKSEEFSTIQNLFNTINLNHPQLPQQNRNQQNQGANSQINLSNIDLNDFNTMQNMFTTSNQISAINSSQSTQNKPKQQENSIKNNINFDLNIQPNAININDFNTMQNMFATNNYNIPVSINTNQIPEIKQMNKKEDIPPLNTLNINDFSTMQNLFKTNNVQNQNSVSQSKKQNQLPKDLI